MRKYIFSGWYFFIKVQEILTTPIYLIRNAPRGMCNYVQRHNTRCWHTTPATTTTRQGATTSTTRPSAGSSRRRVTTTIGSASLTNVRTSPCTSNTAWIPPRRDVTASTATLSCWCRAPSSIPWWPACMDVSGPSLQIRGSLPRRPRLLPRTLLRRCVWVVYAGRPVSGPLDMWDMFGGRGPAVQGDCHRGDNPSGHVYRVAGQPAQGWLCQWSAWCTHRQQRCVSIHCRYGHSSYRRVSMVVTVVWRW